jgi:hypothetical protein
LETISFSDFFKISAAKKVQEKIEPEKVPRKKEAKPVVPSPEIIPKTEEQRNLLKIYAAARGLRASKDWSREVQLVFDNGKCLHIYWDQKGQLYYRDAVIDEESSMAGYIRNNECYEMNFKKGKIDVKTPQFLLEGGTEGLKDNLRSNEKAPIETDGVGKVMKKCKDHPLYTGKRIPRSGCMTCMEMYISLHPEYEIVEH